MRSFSGLRPLFIVSILTLGAAAFADDKPAPKSDTPEAVTRFYNIKSLLAATPNHPLPDDWSTTEPSETTDADDSGTPQDKTTQIMRLIQDTIESDSWKDNGGVVGSIQEISGRLIITQLPATQEKIRTLLDQLGSTQERGLINVRAYWLTLTPQEVGSLYRDRKGGGSLPVVPDAMLEDQHLYSSAQIAGFSGQIVHTLSAHKVSYVSAVAPIKKSDPPKYQPTYDDADSGVRLQVKATLNPTGDHVLLDLQSMNQQTKIDVLHGDEPRADDKHTTDHELSTTVQIAVGQNILIGGVTIDPSANGAPPQQLFMVVNAEPVK